MEQAGRKASISIVGNPVAMSMEACPNISDNDTAFQIADITKRIIDKNTPVSIFEVHSSVNADMGTNNTTVVINGHGLVTGDMIINNSRSDAKRIVTRVNDTTLTVASIPGQTIGDAILLAPKSTNFTVDYMYGIVLGHADGDIYISGSYLPKTLVATAYDYSYNQASDMADITSFLATHKKRMPLLKYASGTLSYWDITDPYFTDALLADTPKYIVLEDGISQKALLAYFDKTELKASIGNPQSMTVGFINANGEVG
jgi:hypothetical protein